MCIYSSIMGTDGIHHNLVKRNRHQGIVSGTAASGNVYSNEIYMDSYATNAFGIRTTGHVHDNKIFGTGYHLDAISNQSNTTYRDNLIFLQGVAPSLRSPEYGTYSSVNGIRLTEYTCRGVLYENNLYEGNTIIVKGRDGCNIMRGVQFSSDPFVVNLRFRGNTIKTEVQDAITPVAPCVVAHGVSECAADQLPVLYENNTFITNSVHVRFVDNYAGGGNHQFRNNVFRRIAGSTTYHTIMIGYWIPDSFGNLFIDSVVEGGASLEDNVFGGSGRRDYAVGHSLHVQALGEAGVPIANDTLRVEDNTGVTYGIATDGQGYARLELLEYGYAAAQGVPQGTRTAHEGHNLRISGYQPYVVNAELFAIHNNGAAPVPLVFSSLDPPPDTQAPASVTTLAVGSMTSTTATLTWTAVGDDGNTGTATTYDLRYSTSAIDATNFASATQVAAEPAPKAAGQVESFTVTDLFPSTTYYFAITVADEVPNWSAISNLPSGATEPGMDRKSDGAIAVWGNNGEFQSNVPPPNTGFVAVAARGYHAQDFASKQDGDDAGESHPQRGHGGGERSIRPPP